MASLSATIADAGYAATSTSAILRKILAQHGLKETVQDDIVISAAEIAKAIGMMARTMGIPTDTSRNAAWLMSGQEQSLTAKTPESWNIDLFVQEIVDLVKYSLS